MTIAIENEGVVFLQQVQEELKYYLSLKVRNVQSDIKGKKMNEG